MKTLALFNAVVSKPSKKNVHVSEKGFIVESGALWALDRILAFYESERLNGNDLNKTFYKSWEKVRNSSRYELYLDQITHYLSTYGTNFQGEVFIPAGELDLPVDLRYKVVKAYTKEEMTEKCLDMLRSGIALKEETINDLLSVLVDELAYVFTGDEGIRNKEAIIKIADMYGVVPKDTMEFFRYIVYRATGQSLLIKNKQMVEEITESNFNPAAQFNQHGLDKLATIFNRFKPLFLAFKAHCPSVINRISRLSKTHHKPMVQNPLNLVTSRLLTDEDQRWLDKATPYALFKAYAVCFTRLCGQDTFLYRIRNGKSWLREGVKGDRSILARNAVALSDYLQRRFNMLGKKVYIPEDVDYALPTSEKMFVGNVPTGSRFYGDRLAVGFYWEDAWGASDIDLSGINAGDGKIGWNAAYRDRTLTYSGDITSAPNGAVEYLHSDVGLSDPYLIMANIYYGQDDSGYKIIVGRGSSITRDYMMDPNNLFMEVRTEAVQKQNVLGMLLPSNMTESEQQCFVVLNFGAGQARVSGANPNLLRGAIKALVQQWTNQPSLNGLLTELGVEFVDNPLDADYDLSLDNLEKDSFTKLFTETKVLEKV